MTAGGPAPSLSLRGILGELRDLFSRATRRELVVITVLSAVLAVFETFAVVAVLPLVELAMGKPTSVNLDGLRSVFGNPDTSTFGAILAVIVVGVFVAKDALSALFVWWQSGVIARQRVETSVTLMRMYLYENYTLHRQRSSAEIIRIVNDGAGQVYSLVVSGVIMGVTSAVGIIAIVIGMLLVSPVPTLLLLVYFGVIAGLYVRLVRPRVEASGRSIVDASVQGYLRALHALGAFKEVKLRHSQEFFVARYRSALREGAQAGRVGGFFGVVQRYLLEVLFIVALGALLLYAFLNNSGGQAVAVLGLFVAAGFRLMPYLSQVVSSLNNVRLGSASLQTVHAEVLRAKTVPTPRIDTTSALRFRKRIRLDGVSFRYPDSQHDVLSNVSLSIGFGTSVAFVGASGSGKTTMVDLVLGLLTPTKGRILVDDVDVADHIPSWQLNTAMVPQEVYLTGLSLAENVAFDEAPEDIDPERLSSALSRAELDDLIADLPDGVETLLWDAGGRLSGGQKQRVGIARALYHDPQVLVLDEATSALDGETERRITETIDHLHGQVTVLVVAHRLSTVRNVDLVVFLQKGRVAAKGTYDELVRDNADFARLVALGSVE